MAVSELALPSIDVELEFDGNVGFLVFDEQEGANFLQESKCFLAAHDPSMQGFVPSIGTPTSFIEASPKAFVHNFKRRGVSHVNAGDNLQAFVLPVLSMSGDCDAALAIKKTGGVSDDVIQSSLHEVIDGMMANSVEVRCPARKGAEGQYRAKQGESPGVCREHVPSPKGKICSELGRNVERLAETPSPVSEYIALCNVSAQVTDCNTNYLQLVVHQDADLEIMDDLRPVNQDGSVTPILWMGNLTCSNRKLQAVGKA